MGSLYSRCQDRKVHKRAQCEKVEELRRAEERERRARRRKSRQIKSSVREINEERRQDWEAYREKKDLDTAIANSNAYPARRSNHVYSWAEESYR